jgi:gas vesicle protein
MRLIRWGALVPVLMLGGIVSLRAEITAEDLRQLQTRFQQAEESEERLRARIQKLEATIAELRSQIGEVRSVASSAGKDSVTQDQLKKVLDQLRDLDRRRQEDNEKVLQQIKKLADLPAPQPPSFDEPKSKGRKPAADAGAGAGPGVGRADAKTEPKAPDAKAEPPKPSLPPDYEFYEHVVRENQSLGQIITEYNKGYGLKVRLKHVLEANPKLRPERLVPGQKVRIPVVK